MATPIAARRNYGDENLQLYFPMLTTSPAMPQAGDSYLSEVALKDLDVKAIYLEKGESQPNLSWNGEKYDWASDVTEIQTDFVDSGGESDGNFNLLQNTALSTGSKRYWTGVFEDPFVTSSSSKEQTYNWVYSKAAPSETSSIWVDTTDDTVIEPQYWNGAKWTSYYDLKEKALGGKVSLEKDGASRHQFHIEKAKKDYVIGIAQYAKLSYLLWNGDTTTVSFDMEEIEASNGTMIRLEYYDVNQQLIQTKFSPRFFNKSSAKKRVNFAFIYTDRERGAKYIRVSIIGVNDNRIVNAEINKIKAELGERDTGWNLHEEEVLLNLNAGEIELPVLNGELDLSKIISEIAILRSTLGEGLLKWEEVTRLKSSSVQEAVLYDYFVENGNYYRYALQPILANGMKGAITSFYDTVTTFDGFWLLGEEDHQFSFIYNGKIGSIRHVKPSEIIETIGSKYPYIIRSSEQDYKTYTFSGTLTHHQDVHRKFISDDYSVSISPDPTIPIGFVELKYGDEMLLNYKNDLEELQDGMVMQRLWRKKILTWLKDGKPKIMKSEAQGNLLVVLSEIEETPNETTFGLISDFSCVVTEIGELNEKTLQKYKLRKTPISKDELVKEAIKEDSL